MEAMFFGTENLGFSRAAPIILGAGPRKSSMSNTTHSPYMANTCIHCGALQGRNYVVEDPHEIIEELWHSRGMDKF